MALRTKWEIATIEENCILEEEYNNTAIDRHAILEILDGNSLTTHFQPIFSAKDGVVYGYEALTRIKDGNNGINIGDLFKAAIQASTISSLDVRCRENALRLAASMDINNKYSYLFINICPEALMDKTHSAGITDMLTEEWNIPKDKVILEITEESAIHNYTLFQKTIIHYRQKGYKIAIDDFGTGYGGLKMLSVIEPDFVKIDRHFISNIDKAIVKFNLVDSIASACHKLGIKVIAEGIEREEELKIVISMGIELLQGFYLHRPSPTLNGDNIAIPVLHNKKNTCCISGECLIGDIADNVKPIHPLANITEAFNRFIKEPTLRGIPVVDDQGDRIVGMLHRNRFLENSILGKYGFGMHLNAAKPISILMEQPTIMVEINTALEDVANRIPSREYGFLYDDICVTQHGKYYGTVAVNKLLYAITDKSIRLARNANPLTGLPGNESIQREINKRLSQNTHFDVCYIDINNFKPYNDYYGFEKGDIVIKSLAGIIEDSLQEHDSSINFAGHIGGDDFIVIVQPQISIPLCNKIISAFEAKCIDFHGNEDYERKFYITKNRKDEEETFSLLSISIGIVSTEVYSIKSFAQLASIATEVKKSAKIKANRNGGSAVVRDRRLMG